MKNICPNLDDNRWGYITKNNILAFYLGPFSQWWGGFSSQNHPIRISTSTIANNIVSPSKKDEFFDKFEPADSDGNIVFNTAEQGMMFGKALCCNDFESAEKILLTSKPKDQKQLGRFVKNYNEKLWSQLRLNWVSAVNLHKFSQHEDLKNFLVHTCKNFMLVEASPIDRIWGIGSATEEECTFHIERWKGQNLLGRALMRVREELS